MNYEKEDMYIIPHNYIDAGKILGFIERESLVAALVWLVPLTLVNFRFLPVSVDIRIFIFILLICPPTIILLVGIGGETVVDFLRYYHRFSSCRKVYLYEKGGFER
ncbi:MAG: hypothetical protein FIA99_04340 [Ruminiclostridium sp.]|nr:hypothetical protein [Ruminiclostridium sp.]